MIVLWWLACTEPIALRDPAEVLFDQLDHNADQKITPADSAWDGLRDVLRDLDTDNGGYVDASELRAHLEAWPDRSSNSAGPLHEEEARPPNPRSKVGKASKAKGRRR